MSARVTPANGLRMEVSKPVIPGVETLPQFWNPGLFGINFAPEDFREKLHSLDPGLEVTWNRSTERWQVFYRTHRATHPLCRGWRLLFVVHDGHGAYVPLDERTLAKCYLMSGYQWRDGRQYFESVMRETEREKALVEKDSQDEITYKAGEYFDYTRPKVGYGAISASKVVGQ